MNQKTAHLTQREKKLRHQKAMRLKKIRRIKRIIKTGSVCLVIVFAVCLFRNITSPEGKAENKPAAISANVEDAGFQNTSSSVSVVGNIQGEYVDDLKAMVSEDVYKRQYSNPIWFPDMVSVTPFSSASVIE